VPAAGGDLEPPNGSAGRARERQGAGEEPSRGRGDRYTVAVWYLDVRHVFSCTAEGDITVDEEVEGVRQQGEDG
jgi:hypothetical protein